MDRMPVAVKIAYYCVHEAEQAVLMSTLLSILSSLDASKASSAASAFNFLYDFNQIAAMLLQRRSDEFG
jgi:hypothetical protein